MALICLIIILQKYINQLCLFDLSFNRNQYGLVLAASYSLHINCGGKEESINGTTKFDADTNTGKSSLFFAGAENWGFSITGNFMDDDRTTDDFIALNSSALTMPNPELYVRARISPISLTYYAHCLGSGNYTVSLHFAEIVFTNDKTFRSLGRRLFDVYIQVHINIVPLLVMKLSDCPISRYLFIYFLHY